MRAPKLYVASSFRNGFHPYVVERLQRVGYDVYDFRRHAFRWADIDGNWQSWSHEEYVRALSHPIANEGYARDYAAMQSADACVLVLPAGRSSHLEAGWFIGSGKPLYILGWDNGDEAELMYKLATLITDDLLDLISRLTLFYPPGAGMLRDPDAPQDPQGDA